MKRRALRFVGVSLGLALGLGACRGCRKEGPAQIVDLAAADVRLAVHVPELAGLVRGIAAFAQGATKRQGPDTLKPLQQNLVNQFGFDFFNPAGYKDAGVDLGGGVLVFSEAGFERPVLALTLTDAKRFEEGFKRLLAKVEGASAVSEQTIDGRRVLTAGRPFGTESVPAVHWSYFGRYALIVRANGRPALEAALKRLGVDATIPPQSTPAGSRSLGEDPAYRTLLAKVPPGVVSVFVRPSAGTASEAGQVGLATGAITRIDLNDKGFSLDTFAALEVPGLDKALSASPVLELSEHVGDDAVLVLLTRAARPQSIAALRASPLVTKIVGRALTPLAQATGLDPEKDLLPPLAGPLTVSVHLADLASLPERLRQARSLNSLLDSVHVALSAELGDPPAMLAALRRAKSELGKRGISLRERTFEINQAKLVGFEPAGKGEPRLGWGVFGNHYLYGAGPGRFMTSAKLLEAGKSGLAAKLKEGVAGTLAAEPGATVLVLRSSVLADAAAAIQVGSSEQTAGLASLTRRFADVLRSLGDVAAAFSAEPDGVRLRIRERLQ